MKKYQEEIKQFAIDRNWDQFHNPKDLLLGIVEEIGEFRNLIKWEQDPQIITKVLRSKHAEVEDTIGDIMWFLAILANSCNVDIEKAIRMVIKENKKRFPVSKTKNAHTNIHLGGHDGKYVIKLKK